MYIKILVYIYIYYQYIIKACSNFFFFFQRYVNFSGQYFYIFGSVITRFETRWFTICAKERFESRTLHFIRLDAIIHSITLWTRTCSFFSSVYHICRNIKTVTNFYLNRHRNIESISLERHFQIVWNIFSLEIKIHTIIRCMYLENNYLSSLYSLKFDENFTNVGQK